LDAFGGGGAGAGGIRDGLPSYLYGSYSSSSSSADALAGGGPGGGGGVERAGARGADEGGGGGGAGGTAPGGGGGGALGVEDGGIGGGAGGAPPGSGGARAGDDGGGGAIPDGLRDEGGGIGGFLPIGGGGFGFMLILDTTDDGLESLSPPKIGFGGGRPPGIGGAGGAPGGFGAEPRGGLGIELRDVSGSDRYGALLCSAPVLTPPAFLSFGMPPANMPASCGGAGIALSPVSLLLRARFPGGASPPGGAGGLPMPGTGGAPVMAGADGPSETLPTMGDDRSFTTVTFFSRAPLPMSDSRAPCAMLAVALSHATPASRRSIRCS
jgi:hypothetical protein